jgi:hypothetical protein
MSDQPEALRLADELLVMGIPADVADPAAAELRRLHGEVKRMRETLSICESVFRDSGYVNCAHFIRNALKEPK